MLITAVLALILLLGTAIADNDRSTSGGAEPCVPPPFASCGSGETGPAGPQGETGPMGPQGPQGEVGPVGPAGPVGPIGPQGIQGPKGDPGAQGAQGPKGDTGPQGPAGAAGKDGQDGQDGAPGARGPAGPAGLAGSAGLMGPAGPRGPQGLQGERGPRGLQGEPGDRAEWLEQSGQSLVDSGVLRFEPMSGAWVSANYGDSFEELIGLVFKSGNDYYLSGSIIADLRGVATGEIYYLGTDGQLTTQVPSSGFVVVLGKGIGASVLLFDPYLPVQNDAFMAVSGSSVQLAGN